MSDFTPVAKVGDIPVGEGRSYPLSGTLVAVFRVAEDEYRAINDFCPHMGAQLSTGYWEDGAVTCPWHAWRFCTSDGKWLDNPDSPISVACYEVKVDGDDICVSVPEGGATTWGRE